MEITIIRIAIDHSIVVNIWMRFLAEPKRALPYLVVLIGGAFPRRSPILSTVARTAASDGGMNVFGCPGIGG